MTRRTIPSTHAPASRLAETEDASDRGGETLPDGLSNGERILASLLDPVLDATRAEVSAYGVRRATMTSVARRAGISRATLYRRATSLDQLVQDALVAEFQSMFEAALKRPHPEPTSRAHIVDAARGMLEELAESEFTNAIIDHDPELLLPYLVDRLGRTQESLLEGLETAIVIAQSHGSVRAGTPRILALACLQALTPYVISLRLLEQEADRDVWFREAAHLVDAYLRPEPWHTSANQPDSSEQATS